MTRTLKILGLTSAALLLCAVAASAALAVTSQFEVGTGDGNVLANQFEPIVFTVAGGRTLTCEGTSMTGSMSTTSSTLTMTPQFNNCHSVLSKAQVPVTITPNGCTYLIHLGDTVGTDRYIATTDIVCPPGKDIEIHVYTEGTTTKEHTTAKQLCDYTIQAQTGLSSVEPEVTTNPPPPKEIDFILNVAGIAYTRTAGNISQCGAAAGKGSLTGKYNAWGLTTGGVGTDLLIVEV